MVCLGPVFVLGLVLPFRHRGLDRLGSEFWMSGAPRIGRGMSAADWTGFGSGSAWLLGLWVSVLGFWFEGEVSCGVVLVRCLERFGLDLGVWVVVFRLVVEVLRILEMI